MSVWITPPKGTAGDAPRVAVKDIFDTAGTLTTYGSAIFARNVPQRSAAAVTLLEQAGYDVTGKANLHEFAFGITSQNEHYGTVPNPVAPRRTAGGSSGGSAAAVAGGEAEIGLGTDTGGSIRVPAACCEVTGFKPTAGAVPMAGCFPLAPSFDCAGPLARDVSGCAEAMRALSTLASPPVDSLREVRVGLAWIERTDDEVAAVVERAARLVPRLDAAHPMLAVDVVPAFQAEIAEVHRELFGRFKGLYGSNVRAKIERCMDVSAEEWEEARRARKALRRSFRDALDARDVLIAPTLPISPPSAAADELDVRADMTLLTFPVNAVGAPALALPCGRLADGSPVSLQVIGRPGADGLVLAVGAKLEEALRNTAGPKSSN